MMEWRDKGYVVSMRKHGESSAIIEVLTECHGRHAGYVKGGAAGKKLRGVLLLGNEVDVRWSARLEEQLGAYQVELLKANAVRLLDDAFALEGLTALCALVRALPERQAIKRLHGKFALMIEELSENKEWLNALCAFELELLQELGYGLEPAQREALPLALPARLAAIEGFLLKRIYQPHGLPIPPARKRLGQKIKG